MTDFASLRTAMVDCQVRPSDVTKYPVIDAMLTVPREVYVPAAKRTVAYADAPIPFAPGRAMLEPRTLARMLDALSPGPDELALVVGSGYGYSAAVMSRLAQAVVALEEDPEAASEAASALAAHDADNVIPVEGPLAEGAPKHGPYDVMLIEGGIETLPDALAGQLREGGRIVALRMDGQAGEVCLGVRHGGHIAWRPVFNAAAQVLPGFSKAKAFAL